MKKLGLILVVGAMVLALAACQQSGETPASGDVPESGDTESVVICVEADLEDTVQEAVDYLTATGNTTSYELLVLPRETQEREQLATRLRTEIMAGKGPDAFILGTVDPLAAEPLEGLFPDPEKAMRSHLFLDLEELVRKSELVKLEQCNALVMDTGVLGEKRFLLPILYTVSGLAMQKSDLQDPDYTFSTLDELFSGAEPGLCQAADTRVVTFFPHLFGSLADYDTGELLVTQNQVLDMMKSISQAQESAQTPEETQVTAVTAGNVGSAFFDQTAALDCAYFPIPNREGGVTGTVRVFGAINANTTHVGEAFSILELLLSDDVQGGTGLKAKGKTYCNLFPFGNFLNRSMPVKDGLTEKLFGLSQEQADAAQEMAEKITVVRLPSTLDVMLYSLYWDYPKNAPVEMVEEWEKQLPMVISSMEMALAE